jgi:hypothetical protein
MIEAIALFIHCHVPVFVADVNSLPTLTLRF